MGFRKTFAGDEDEKAYLYGLRTGDLSCSWSSRWTVWTRLSTTHPAMAELFYRTFREYGRCLSRPDEAYITGRYCWKLDTYLDASFGFFVKKPNRIPVIRPQFYWFFGGYSDCEGCWCIYNDKGSAAVAFVIESQDHFILKESAAELSRRGFHPLLYEASQNSNKPQDRKSRLELRRRDEVRTLANKLSAISRHPEKIAKMALVLETAESNWARMNPRIRELKASVKSEVTNFTKLAEIQYNMSHGGTLGKGVVC